MRAILRHPQAQFDSQSTPHVVELTEYELPIDNITNESGHVTIASNIDFDPSGMVLRIDEFPDEIWFVTQKSSASSSTTTLDVVDYTGAADGIICDVYKQTPGGVFVHFDGYLRSIFYYQSGIITGSLGLSNFQYVKLNNSPQHFREWLDAHAPTVEDLAIDDNDGLTSAGMVLRYLRSIGINTKGRAVFEGALNSFYLFDIGFIPSFGADPLNVVFNDGHSEVLIEDYKNDICSKVVFGGGTDQYFLATDGVTVFDYLEWVSETYEQMKGDTRCFYDPSLNTDAKKKAKAAEIFAENTASHKIVFASDREFRAGQTVRLHLNRGILETAISSVTIKSNDNRKIYTCGDIPVTASEYIKNSYITESVRRPNNLHEGQLVLIGGK